MDQEQRVATEVTVASERVYNGRVVSLRVDTVALPNGRHYKREVVEHRGAVAIVALDGQGNVLLVRQFRKAAGRQLLEIPAGTLEPGEDPLRCGERELQEETGYRARALEKLTGFYVSPGYGTEYLHVYLAREIEEGTMNTEPDEQIQLVKVPFAEALALVDAGEICDAKSIVGLLMARQRLGS